MEGGLQHESKKRSFSEGQHETMKSGMGASLLYHPCIKLKIHLSPDLSPLLSTYWTLRLLVQVSHQLSMSRIESWYSSPLHLPFFLYSLNK